MAAIDYDWHRFWVPPDVTLALDDGFTPDTEGFFGRAGNPQLRSFDEIAEYRLLFLIGEPGIGKSRALQDATEYTSAELLTGDDATVLVDMGETTSEDWLRESIFGSAAFLQWREGTHRLHLFLDSLDEARAAMPKIKRLLVTGLEGADFDRLHLRIACRTADRLEGLEESLKQSFGAKASAEYELAPLQLRDVRHAAHANEMDGQWFVQEVLDRGLQALANKPITLALLLEIVKNDGDFPDRNTDVYERGCRKLCQEPREDAVRQPSPPDVLLAVASRMAAATVLSGRTLVALADQADEDNSASLHDFLSADDVAGDPPIHREQAEQLVREVIGTSLFSARGNAHVGWYHQTVAEYLAARHLESSGLELPALVRLLMTEIEGRVASTPQLAEVVKWLAQLNDEFKAFVLANCPTSLVGGDMRYLTNDERRTVVQEVFVDVENQAADTWDRPFFRSLKFLGNEALGEQIEEVLGNGDLHAETHEVALRMIGDCGIQELTALCADIALDSTWPVRTRIAALWVISDIGTDEDRERVAPLAIDPPIEDESDELKGAALRAAFPSAIGTRTLFDAITPAKDPNNSGGYSSFLHYSVVPNLSDNDLIVALDWVASLDPELDPLSNEGWLSDDILARSFELPLDHVVWPKVSAIVSNRLEKHREIVGLGVHRNAEDLTEDMRRKLTVSLLDRIQEGTLLPSGLRFSRPKLMRHSDRDWAIEQLQRAAGTPAEPGWAHIVISVVHPSTDPVGYLQADDVSDAFHELTQEHRSTPLGTGFDEVLREKYEDEQQGNERGPQEFGSTEQDIELVSGWLEAFEAGDLTAWWQLGSGLEGEYRRLAPTHQGSDAFVRLYTHLTPELQNRLLAIAKEYLLRQDPETEQWVGTHHVNQSAFGGYQAIRLLLALEPEWFDREGLGTLERWVHVLLWWSTGDDEESEIHRALIRQTFDAHPEAVARAFGDITHGNLQTAISYPYPMSRVFEDLDFELFERELFAALDADHGTEEQKANILDYMVAHGSAAATQRASDLVASGPDSEDGTPERFRAIAAASSLVTHVLPDGWPVVAAAAHANSEFGKAVATYISDRRDTSPWTRLDEHQLSKLFEWLQVQFPAAEDPPHRGQLNWRHDVARTRNNTLHSLTQVGTESAVAEIKRLEARFPELEYLPRQRHIAIEELVRQEWDPPTPSEIVELCRDPLRRHVASEADLQESVMRSLERLQARVDTTTEVDDFWNTSPDVKPKYEGEISEKLKRWLVHDLAERGVIVNREATVRTLPRGGDGERIDVKVEAVSQDGHRLAVVIEVKGCWNDEIPGSIEDQLVDKYLEPQGLRHGIYLVAWFGSNRWADERRKSKARCRGARESIVDEIEAEAKIVSERRAVAVDTVVLDLHQDEFT